MLTKKEVEVVLAAYLLGPKTGMGPEVVKGCRSWLELTEKSPLPGFGDDEVLEDGLQQFGEFVVRVYETPE